MRGIKDNVEESSNQQDIYEISDCFPFCHPAKTSPESVNSYTKPCCTGDERNEITNIGGDRGD